MGNLANQSQVPAAQGDTERFYSVLSALLGYNPDWHTQNYDFPAAFQAGVMFPDPASRHWPSKFKTPDHPNRFVPLEEGGYWDTLTNQSAESPHPKD